MRVRDRLGVSERRQRQLSRAMQFGLVGILFVGLDRGNPGIAVNAGLALLVTELPAALERNYAIPMDPALTLWITTAVFLHGLGTSGLPLPGTEASFYATVPWWDSVTHALSSSVVAAAGYAVVRALDLHSDAVHLPPKFVAVFLILFVLAFGVFWEVIEFVVGLVAAPTGDPTVLTQYGLSDTMLDLAFDAVGGVLVAASGGAYLGDVTGALETRLARR